MSSLLVGVADESFAVLLFRVVWHPYLEHASEFCFCHESADSDGEDGYERVVPVVDANVVDVFLLESEFSQAAVEDAEVAVEVFRVLRVFRVLDDFGFSVLAEFLLVNIEKVRVVGTRSRCTSSANKDRKVQITVITVSQFFFKGGVPLDRRLPLSLSLSISIYIFI